MAERIEPNKEAESIEKTIVVKTAFSYTPKFHINLQLKSPRRNHFQEADTVMTACSQRGTCPVYLRGSHNTSPISAIPDRCPGASALTSVAAVADNEDFYDLDKRYCRVSCEPAGNDRFWMNVAGLFPDGS